MVCGGIFSAFCFEIRQCNTDMKIAKIVIALSTNKLLSNIRCKRLPILFFKMTHSRQMPIYSTADKKREGILVALQVKYSKNSIYKLKIQEKCYISV